jgi:predicted dehydrogenase
MTTTPLGLGIVGTGGAGSLVGDAVSEASRVELRACTARTSESAHKFATRRGAAVHESLDGLLADKAVEAVYIATPNSLHHEQTEAALKAGKHVLVEKPMALRSIDAQQTVALAAQLERIVGVGFHLRHSDIFRELKRQLDSGEIGTVSLIRAEWGMPLGVLQEWKNDPVRAGAGALMGLGVHILDLMLWLTGGPVQATTSRYSAPASV